jgi:hypothetical protein
MSTNEEGEICVYSCALVVRKSALGLPETKWGLARMERAKSIIGHTLSFTSSRFVFYSNRVPATSAQKVAITLPLASRISTEECVVSSSPLAPSSEADLTLCDPIKTPLES